jgi:hypothetical protein
MVMSDDGIPDFDDDPTIDTVYSLYQRSRTDLDPESKAEIQDRFFPFSTKDVIQPCGYTENVLEHFFTRYTDFQDIGVLIKMLEQFPVYGSKDISKELIRLLKKSRIKPVSDEVYTTKKLHDYVQFRFWCINPKRGEADNTYAQLATEFGLSFENVKTIIKRSRKVNQS